MFIHRHRHRLGALLALGSAALLAAGACAATPITVSAAPSSVAPGQRVTLRGAGWGVIEFCTPRVTLALARSVPLPALHIRTVALRTRGAASGTFSTSWRVPSTVHGGVRRVVATQHCESGKNGAPRLIVRSTTVRVISP